MNGSGGPYRRERGGPVALGPALGRGGEAEVRAVAGEPDRAAKVWTEPTGARVEKLRAMLRARPASPNLAWPEEALLDASGRACGFVMRRAPAGALPLHDLANPAARRARAPGADPRFLLRAARNLAAEVAALHEAGVVAGDLNGGNVLVDDRALVTLIDLDSAQVRDGARVHRCTVGTPETTPPELHGRAFRDVDRAPRHDAFALAVLVATLLLEGVHPFSGRWTGPGEPPGVEGNAAARRSAVFGAGRGRLEPPPLAPPAALLAPGLRRVLRRALLAPPRLRPGARALQRELERAEAALRPCPRSESHPHGRHLRACPWCERAERLGRDPFPSRGGKERRARPRPPAPAPAPAPPAAPGATARPPHRLAPLATLLALAGSAGLGALAAPALAGLARSAAGAGPAAAGLPLLAVAATLLLPPLAAWTVLARTASAAPARLRRIELLARAVAGLALAALALRAWLAAAP